MRHIGMFSIFVFVIFLFVPSIGMKEGGMGLKTVFLSDSSSSGDEIPLARRQLVTGVIPIIQPPMQTQQPPPHPLVTGEATQMQQDMDEIQEKKERTRQKKKDEDRKKKKEELKRKRDEKNRKRNEKIKKERKRKAEKRKKEKEEGKK